MEGPDHVAVAGRPAGETSEQTNTTKQTNTTNTTDQQQKGPDHVPPEKATHKQTRDATKHNKAHEHKPNNATNKKVLTMSRLRGVPLVDLEGIKRYTSDPEIMIVIVFVSNMK